MAPALPAVARLAAGAAAAVAIVELAIQASIHVAPSWNQWRSIGTKPAGSARTGRAPRATVRAAPPARQTRRSGDTRGARTVHATRVRIRRDLTLIETSACRRDLARIVEKTAADRIAVLAVEKPKTGDRKGVRRPLRGKLVEDDAQR